jgi:hypothetical protein
MRSFAGGCVTLSARVAGVGLVCSAPLHHCTIAPLHHCTIAPLHHCTIAPLHHCTIAPLMRMLECVACGTPEVQPSVCPAHHRRATKQLPCLPPVAKSERITLSTSVGALRLDHYEAGHYDASLEKGHSGRERRREDKALAGNQQRQGTFW